MKEEIKNNEGWGGWNRTKSDRYDGSYLDFKARPQNAKTTVISVQVENGGRITLLVELNDSSQAEFKKIDGINLATDYIGTSFT